MCLTFLALSISLPCCTGSVCTDFCGDIIRLLQLVFIAEIMLALCECY